MDGMRHSARKIITWEGVLNQTQLDQLTSPADLEVVQLSRTGSESLASEIMMLSSPPINADIYRNIELTDRDFNEVGGQPPEHRGVPGSKTATQVNEMAQYSSLREQGQRGRIAAAYRQGYKRLLDSLQANLTLPMAIAIRGAEGELFMADFDVDVDVVEMEPPNTEAEQVRFVQAWQIIGQSPWLVSEPDMAEAFLDLMRVKNQRLRDSLVTAAQAQMAMLAAPAQPEANGAPPPQDEAQAIKQQKGAGL